MSRVCAFLPALILPALILTAAAASLGPARAARLGYSRAYCLSETLSAAEAVSACTAVLQRAKNNAAVFLRRGAAFGELGAFDYAIGDFSRAIRLAPEDALALRLRGLVYEMQGRVEESLADYRRLQELGGDDPDVEAAIRRMTQTAATFEPLTAPAPRSAENVAVAAMGPSEASPSNASGPWLVLAVAGLICVGAAFILRRMRSGVAP